MKINTDTDVLLVVDVQNEFVTGSLAVPSAEEIIPVIAKLEPRFHTIIYSRDAHIKKHPSFKAQGGPWPEHCVIDTHGYRLHSGLTYGSSIPVMVNKGLEEEAYSAFAGTIVSGSGYRSIKDLLKFRSMRQLFICGLATDYCVKATVLDALKLFNGEVFVLLDAVRAVNVEKRDDIKAIRKMVDSGATFLNSSNLED